MKTPLNTTPPSSQHHTARQTIIIHRGGVSKWPLILSHASHLIRSTQFFYLSSLKHEVPHNLLRASHLLLVI
ncbi:MAG: hypothetical protein KKG04_02900 [Candidatus Thermoplasmatota archaeon]|nr:hypothetical protein [Candidatus Thermoplasmatota archaeon]